MHTLFTQGPKSWCVVPLEPTVVRKWRMLCWACTYATNPYADAAAITIDSEAELATTRALGDALRLGRGEEMSGGRAKETILADAVEAVLGAIFHEAGFDKARDVPGLELVAVPASPTEGLRDYGIASLDFKASGPDYFGGQADGTLKDNLLSLAFRSRTVRACSASMTPSAW